MKEIGGGINSAGSGALWQSSDSEGEGAIPDQSEIAALTYALRQSELQLSSIEEIARKREEEVSAAAGLLRLRESRIASLEDELRRKGAEIEDIVGLLRLREATIGHLEGLLRLRESEIQSASAIIRVREENISTMEKLLSSIEEVIKKKDEEVSDAASILRLRESTIALWEDERRRKGAEIEDIVGLLQLREATIRNLEDLLRLREGEIQSSSAIIREREEYISTLERLFSGPATFAASPEWRALPLDEKVSRSFETTEGWCSSKKAAWLTRLIVSRQAANVLEVGIYGGQSLIPIALAVQSTGGGTVIGVEPWSADVAISEPTDEKNDTYWAAVDFARVKARFFANSARYGVLPMIKVMEMDSESAFRFLEPGGRQFDLIHIDGAHSPQRALRDAMSWSSLVRKGGLVVLDDLSWSSVAPARDFLTQNLIVIDEIFETDEVAYGAYEAPL